MLIHRNSCVHQYDTTEEVVEEIIGAFGWAEARWMLVKFEGYDEPECQPEHLLRRDGCLSAIRDFWCKSGLAPDKEFYADEKNHRCDVCAKVYKRQQDLKAHQTKEKHHFERQRDKVTKTAIAAAVTMKRKEMQKENPKVKWGRLKLRMCGARNTCLNI